MNYFHHLPAPVCESLGFGPLSWLQPLSRGCKEPRLGSLEASHLNCQGYSFKGPSPVDPTSVGGRAWWHFVVRTAAWRGGSAPTNFKWLPKIRKELYPKEIQAEKWGLRWMGRRNDGTWEGCREPGAISCICQGRSYIHIFLQHPPPKQVSFLLLFWKEIMFRQKWHQYPASLIKSRMKIKWFLYPSWPRKPTPPREMALSQRQPAFHFWSCF